MLSPFLDLQLRKGVFEEENASFLGKLLFNNNNNKTPKQINKQKPHRKTVQHSKSETKE